ncbi:MAG TPA: hypothetical protein VFE72_08035 [Lysobacter sp.]|nr:hypothetical protein [Lysobacter sp.]
MATWMVRAEGGRLYEAFRRHGVAALGWVAPARLLAGADSRRALLEAYAAAEPARRHSAIVSGASQVWRFAHELIEGDRVLSYSPQRRVYGVGRVTGPALYRPDWIGLGMPLVRDVDWWPREVPRDALPAGARNALGPTLTLFRVAPGAARQVLLRAQDD